MKLADTRAERDLQDSLAEIFSIIITLDELEKAFLKDAIPEAEYAEICERSLKQYKSILADEAVARAFVGLEEFKAEWDVSSRLLRPLGNMDLSGGRATPKTDLTADNSSKSRAQRSASASACRPRP